MAERHRCQNDLMIDEMVAAGKSEQDILTVIVAQYRPYDTLPAFDEGFNAYQTSATRMTMTKRTSGPLQRLGLQRCARPEQPGHCVPDQPEEITHRNDYQPIRG